MVFLASGKARGAPGGWALALGVPLLPLLLAITFRTALIAPSQP
jgi:hypothetical protein